jgi:hypothetical protein
MTHKAEENPDTIKVPAFYKYGALILALFNGLIGFTFAGGLTGDNMSGAIGAGVGASIIWPGIIILLFSISKRFRNETSRYKILFWVSLIIVFMNLLQLLALVASAASEIQ